MRRYFTSLLWVLRRDGLQYSLKPRKILISVFEVLFFPFWLIARISVFISDTLYGLLDVPSKTVTLSKQPSEDVKRKVEREIKNDLVKW